MCCDSALVLKCRCYQRHMGYAFGVMHDMMLCLQMNTEGNH